MKRNLLKSPKKLKSSKPVKLEARSDTSRLRWKRGRRSWRNYLPTRIGCLTAVAVAYTARTWYVSSLLHLTVYQADSVQDDGAHSVACEKCNVWQHSKCLGFTKAEAEKKDFHFLCQDCKQRIDDAKKPKISLKFRAGLSSSPPQHRHAQRLSGQPPTQKFAGVVLPQKDDTVLSQNQGSPTNGYLPTSPRPNVHPGSRLYHRQPGELIQNGSGSSGSGGAPNSRPKQVLSSTHEIPGHEMNRAPSEVDASWQSFSPPPHVQQGHQTRPAFSTGQSQMGPSHSNSRPSTSNNSARPQSSHGQYPPQYNHITHQYQGQVSAVRPPSHGSNHYPSSPTSSNLVNHGPSFAPTTARLPSPIQNRPSMSPTQGNHDVGPLAGVSQTSTTDTSTLTFSTQRTPVAPYPPNGTLNHGPPHSTSAPYADSQKMNHLSGLSPTKQLPNPPSTTSQAAYLNDSSAPGPAPLRSVSGTPILPPIANLVPSPQQLSKTPMPTPGKQATRVKFGDMEGS